MMHDSKKIQEHLKNPKELWRTINSILGNESEINEELEFIYDVDLLITNHSDISNCFNNFITLMPSIRLSYYISMSHNTGRSARNNSRIKT